MLQSTHRGTRTKLVLCAAGLALLIFAIAGGVWYARHAPSPAGEAAAGANVGQVSAAAKPTTELAEQGAGEGAKSDERHSNSATSSSVDEPKPVSDVASTLSNIAVKKTSPQSRQEQPSPAEGSSSVTPETSATVEPKPWQDTANLGGTPRTYLEQAFDGHERQADAPSSGDLRAWFAFQGNTRLHRHEIQDGSGQRQIVRFDGLLRLRPPLEDGAVLRFVVHDYSGLKIHLWRGQRGVTLQYYEPARQAWVAYHTERKKNDDPRPATFTFADSDEDLNWRSHAASPVRYDLHFGSGQLTLTRGDLVLLQLPFGGLPESVYFDGKASLRALSLVRTTSPPPKPAQIATQVVADVESPAELQWQTETPLGATFNKRDDGFVELVSEKSQQPAWVSFEPPRPGVCEYLLELEKPTAGSRLFLAGDDGRPKYALGFFREPRSKGVSLAFIGAFDGRMDWEFDPNHHPAPLMPERFWLRLVFGCGILKCWSSTDGVHWGRPIEPLTNLEGPFERIGLACVPGKEKRTITLRRVIIRELTALRPFAPPELMARTLTVKAKNLSEWLEAIDKHRPEDVESTAWRQASAVQTLASGTSRLLGMALLDLLLDARLKAAAQAENALPLLRDTAVLADHWSDEQDYLRYVKRYEQLGRAIYRGGNANAWSLVAPALATAPLWMRHHNRPQLDDLARWELLASVYDGQAEPLREQLARLRVSDRKAALLSWAEARIAARSPANGNALSLASDRRHPLIEEISKEGFTTLAEFDAALASKAYRDACQIINSMPSDDTLGLLPDSHDPQLSVSLLAAVAQAIEREPELREAMIRDFGRLGILRVRQAMNDADVVAVSAATIQYYGTEAAAEAHVWLGDRATAAGEFAKARSHYEQAQHQDAAGYSARVAPRIRLAAAMAGRDEGEPVTSAVELGDRRLSPAEFEQIVSEMLSRHAPPATSTAAKSQTSAGAPVPSSYTVHERATFDGDAGEKPHEVPEHIRESKVDWVARTLAVATASDRLVVSNRFQVAAYDFAGGERKWRVELGGEHARSHDWPMAPMRPLVVGDRIFVRRLTKAGPELACVAMKDGKILWRGKATAAAVSDPIVARDELVALTVHREDQEHTIFLSRFDPEDGTLLAEQRLFALRPIWELHRTCQLIATGQNLFGVMPGVVFSCDTIGKPRWARRQEWLSPQEERHWPAQAMQPPLLSDGRLYISQPGVKAVECIEEESGRLVWRRVMPTIRRIAGLVDANLIIESGEGLVSLNSASGEPEWYFDTQDLLEAILVGPPGGILCARAEPTKNGSQRLPTLLWLDAATGQVNAHWPLEAIKHDRLMLGPIVPLGDRVWLFAGNGVEDANRKLFELRPSGEAKQGPP